MKWLVLVLGLVGCADIGADSCPPKTAQVALQCKAEVAKGVKTKDQCYQEIESSCP
jgi:hypothetical protein